jgi:hypothetical protein
MRKSGALVLLLVSLLVVSQVAAQGSESSTRPPKNLKKVGDHWTPWDPPPAGPDAYIIVKDDTLWDLAERWLGDPFLWPQIWDENRYILDSHWIYPGDPLVIPGQPTVVPEEGPLPSGEEPEPTGEEPVGEPTGEPVGEPTAAELTNLMPSPLIPIAGPSDVYCSGFIAPEHQYSDLWVAGSEVEEHIIYGEGEVIYLSQGRNQGVVAGDEFAIHRVTGPVVHPVTGESLGQFVRRLGRVRVMLAQENTATGVIDMACEDVWPGDELVPWQEIPIPVRDAMPLFDRYDVTPSGGPAGSVVHLADERDSVAKGHVIQTDLGVASGVRPGDVLTLYRQRTELPRANTGQAVVLTVEPLSCTAKITTSVREIEKGDGVEIVR